MKSIEIKVPRLLIEEYLPHPELYGDYVVMLKNGMHTDVYYDGDTGYFTITNDEKLIEYLKSVKDTKIDCDLRNGVFAFRKLNTDLDSKLEDNEFRNISQSFKVETLSNNLSLVFNQDYIFSFYFIDVAIVEISLIDDLLQFSFRVFNNDIIDNDNLDVCVMILEEHFISKTP